MDHEQEGLKLVRAALCERLAALEASSGRVASRDFVHSLTGLRDCAAAYGLIPVVHVAEVIEKALASDPGSRRVGRGATLYLDRLRDAIGCDRTDDAAGEAMIASVSVRLGA